uniref:Uncharacterized protein n=1 Tax=Mycena chlorophos TaxID=658473 RepID=A0ABQ0KYN8_MYCCL|nr:predicted protein [Mycena chlorophos]
MSQPQTAQPFAARLRIAWREYQQAVANWNAASVALDAAKATLQDLRREHQERLRAAGPRTPSSSPPSYDPSSDDSEINEWSDVAERGTGSVGRWEGDSETDRFFFYIDAIVADVEEDTEDGDGKE